MIIDPETLLRDKPAWRIALLYPPQGHWTEDDYLTLDAGHLVEYDDGCVEVQDVPTREHQRIVQYLYRMMFEFVQSRGLGEVFVAPLPVRLWEKKFREPDVVFVATGRNEYEDYPDGADLVIEVLSEDPGSRRRDLLTKRDEYCRAGISEYWIIDPQQQKVTLAILRGVQYEACEYLPGETANSERLPGFQLNITETLASSG